MDQRAWGSVRLPDREKNISCQWARREAGGVLCRRHSEFFDKNAGEE